MTRRQPLNGILLQWRSLSILRHKMAFTGKVAFLAFTAITTAFERMPTKFTYLNHDGQAQNARIDLSFASFATSTIRFRIFTFVRQVVSHGLWFTVTDTFRMIWWFGNFTLNTSATSNSPQLQNKQTENFFRWKWSSIQRYKCTTTATISRDAEMKGPNKKNFQNLCRNVCRLVDWMRTNLT